MYSKGKKLCLIKTEAFLPVAAWQTGEGQCTEAYGTLGPGCIKFLAKRFQVTQGGGTHQPLTSPPQQGGTTQVNQRAIT